MVLDFENYATKGNEFIRLVALELEVPRDMAGRITRSVLRALRNRLSVEESLHFIAQLPMAIKSVYVDGWCVTTNFSRVRGVHDFLNEIRKEDGNMSGYDFGNDTRAEKAAAAVFKAVGFFVSEGEIDDLSKMLPNDIGIFVKVSAFPHSQHL